jgi:hypothetical protein
MGYFALNMENKWRVRLVLKDSLSILYYFARYERQNSDYCKNYEIAICNPQS